MYTHYLILPTKSEIRISDRFDWDTVNEPEYPTDANTKAEIQSFMDSYGVSGSGTKASLLQAIEEAKPLGDTVTHQANVNDMVERNPQFFAKRESPDGTEYCIKTDLTFDELDALDRRTIKIFTNAELKTYIQDKWVEDSETL